MKKILDQTLHHLNESSSVVWAVVVDIKGSSPREVGSRMMIAPSGQIEGSVGGGRLEAEVIKSARQMFDKPGVELVEIDLTGQSVTETKMICGGKVKVFLETITQDDKEFVNRLVESINNRKNIYLVTLAASDLSKRSSRHFLLENDTIDSWNPDIPSDSKDKIKSSLKDKKIPTLGTDQKGKITFFIEQIKQTDRLFIFGGGHVALELAWVGERTDFQIHIWDNRIELANTGRFPMAYEIYNGECEPTISNLELGPNDYVVIVTPAHLLDLETLRHVIKKSPQYIGLIGSRRKRKMIYEKLEKEGISKERLEQVHSPIGLPIEAETPAELAVSIIAEIIQVRAEAK